MNTSRQLTDLIKNKAKSLGINAQLLLKRYFMEQMLARIAVSQYKTIFILKGGLLISSMVGLSSRATQDIDVSIINKPLTKDEIEKYCLVSNKSNYIGIVICLYTGIRLGELLALTWDDIDFQTEIMSITKTSYRIKERSYSN